MDLKYGDMVTLITLESFKNSEGQTEITQRWEYIRKAEIPNNAKEMTGERNKYLLNKTEEQEYPEWAVNQTHLTATGAYDWLISTKIFDKIYNEFKDWQHIDFKTFLIAALVIIGAIYAFIVMK